MDCNHSAKYAKNMCKKCYTKHWYSLNKDKEKLRGANYYKSNKKKRLKKGKKWREDNKEALRQYYSNKIKTDPQYRLRNLLRARLRSAIKNNQKVGSAVLDLGCSIVEFQKYIESKFHPNPHTGEIMSWDNFGTRWQLDHIKELATFDLSNKAEFLVACNYKNLQPMWTEEHIIKTAKFNAIKSSV